MKRQGKKRQITKPRKKKAPDHPCMKQIFLLTSSLVVLLIGLPLLGVLVTGQEVAKYYEFPPLTHYVPHAPFSWPAFIALACLGLLVATLLFLQLQSQPHASPGKKIRFFTFPWWGYCGLLLILTGWVLAWNRFSWCAPVQAHTFLPLWFGYILLVNGLTTVRKGSCMLQKRPGYFFALFPVSAGFWWFFEYLNRFVQNWYYLGIEDFSAISYVIHASLSFSTVLPAVLSTEEFLCTFSKLTVPLKRSFPVTCRKGKTLALILFLISGMGLSAIGIWPDLLFPLLWLSPLIIIVTVQKVTGQPALLDPLSHGDWRPLWLPALAALVCGFFWELWNVKSYAHWVYSIPFVQKGHIFEMPVLGYLGYLPFGLECKAVALLMEKWWKAG